MKPLQPWWIVPLKCLGAGLGLSLLALIPIYLLVNGGPRKTVTATPPAAPAMPRSQAPAPSATSSPPQAQASPPAPSPNSEANDEADSYRAEMDSLMSQAKLREDAGKQMREIGALDRAVELLREGSTMISVAQCLNNQMKRGVPFYQGKATCNAAMN